MKVYVDELPKSCTECLCEYDNCCSISQKYVMDEKYNCKTSKDCPLQSLSDYTKQVRKEVCEEIRECLLLI